MNIEAEIADAAEKLEAAEVTEESILQAPPRTRQVRVEAQARG